MYHWGVSNHDSKWVSDACTGSTETARDLNTTGGYIKCIFTWTQSSLILSRYSGWFREMGKVAFDNSNQLPNNMRWTEWTFFISGLALTFLLQIRGWHMSPFFFLLCSNEARLNFARVRRSSPVTLGGIWTVHTSAFAEWFTDLLLEHLKTPFVRLQCEFELISDLADDPLGCGVKSVRLPVSWLWRQGNRPCSQQPYDAE